MTDQERVERGLPVHCHFQQTVYGIREPGTYYCACCGHTYAAPFGRFYRRRWICCLCHRRFWWHVGGIWLKHAGLRVLWVLRKATSVGFPFRLRHRERGNKAAG